ncbi:MAG: hypothetical protein ACJATE_001249 [Bacteroidia bacterium]|jgi:hypothetical protein
MAEKFSFYDVKTKSKFESDKYDIRQAKNGRWFAVAKTEAGSEAWRVISESDAKRLK